MALGSCALPQLCQPIRATDAVGPAAALHRGIKRLDLATVSRCWHTQIVSKGSILPQQQWLQHSSGWHPQRQPVGCCSLPQTVNGITVQISASSSSSDEQEPPPLLEEEWHEAQQAAAQQVGQTPSELLAHRQLLQLLLPDMEAHFGQRKTGLVAWQAVADAVGALQPHQIDGQEVELMARVMAAVRAAPRDSTAAMSHNQLVVAASQLFNDARYHGRLTEALKAPLVTRVTALLQSQRQQLLEAMVQQLAVACSCRAYMPNLITLRELLPGADISALMLAHPHLVRLEQTALTERVVQGLAALTPPLAKQEAAALLQAAPFLLEGELLQQVLQELEQLFPEEAPAVMLRRHVHVGASGVLAPYQEAARGLVASEAAAA